MIPPDPLLIYRILHIENLNTVIKQQGVYAPNFVPIGDFPYRSIQNRNLGNSRRSDQIPVIPNGTIHDYAQFYLGPRSPMLFQLHTGWVEGYNETQQSIIYLVARVQDIVDANLPYVFTDGHAHAKFTQFYNKTRDLKKLDWTMIYAKDWNDTIDAPDRQRKKQAEFMIHQFCPWSLIRKIGVYNDMIRQKVEYILDKFPPEDKRSVVVMREWYY